MPPQLQGVPCFNVPNISALQRMRLVRAVDVTALDEITGGAYLSSEPADLAPGAQWQSYDFELDAASFTFTPRQGPHGTYYDLEVSGLFRKLRPDLEAEMLRLQDGYYLLEVLDENGYYRLLGTLEAPMRYAGGGSAPQQRDGFSEAQWRFFGVSTAPGFFLPPPDACALLAGAGMSNFNLYPFSVDAGNADEFLGVKVEPSASGQIQAILTRPSGELRDASGTLVDALVYNSVLDLWAPQSSPYALSAGTYTVSIPGIQVLTKQNSACLITFTQTYAYADGSAPAATIFVPAHLSTGNAVSTDASIAFSETIQAGAGNAELRLWPSGTLVQSIAIADCAILANVITIPLPALQFGQTYSLSIPPGFVRDFAGNAWGGVSASQWVFETEAVQFFPEPGSSNIPVSFDPYIEVTGAIARGTGEARLWVGAGVPADLAAVVVYDIADADLVKIEVIGAKTRLTFRNVFYPDLTAAPYAGIHIPAGWITINGTAWAGTDTPPSDWTWQPSPSALGTFEVLNTSVPEGGSTGTREVWFGMNREIGAFLGNAFRYTPAGAGAPTVAEVVWPYLGRFDVALVRIEESDWLSALSFEIGLIAGTYMVDRTGAGAEAFTLNILRTAPAPTAQITDTGILSAASNEPTCAGAYAAVLTARQAAVVKKTESYSQLTFPTDDLAFFLNSLLPGTYDVELEVTDCAGTSSASASVVRALGLAPTAQISYGAGLLFPSASSPAPYSAGAYDALIEILQGASVVWSQAYDETDLPSELEFSTLLLPEGDYTARLTVTAPDGQEADAEVEFRYEQPCAGITWPDLSENVLGSWSGAGGGFIALNWYDPSPVSLNALDALQALYPAEWQTYFDQQFRPQLITPRETAADFLDKMTSAGLRQKFTGTYGVEIWHLGANNSGNCERDRFIQLPDGRYFFVDRPSTWSWVVYWVEDPTGTYATGTPFRTINFNEPPNMPDGQTDPLGGNRLRTPTSNSMGEVRVMPDSPGDIMYPRDSQLWAYNIETGEDRRLMTSALGQIGNPNDERNPAGGDGNSQPYIILTHGDKFSLARMVDPLTARVLWEELTGPDGARQWVNSTYDAETDTTRRFTWPAGLDYASSLPDGSGMIAAIDGQGLVYYSRSGIPIGQIFSASNHFDVGWFTEGGVRKRAVYTYLTGQSNQNTGIFSGFYIKDLIAVLWDDVTDPSTGVRSITNRRAYKLLDFMGQVPTQGGGQLAANWLNPDFVVAATSRVKNSDNGIDYIFSNQIVLCAATDDTAYPEQLIEETWAGRTNTDVNVQAEAGIGPWSTLPGAYWCYGWFRGFVQPGTSNKAFIFRIYRRPTDAEIAANINP